MADRRGVVPLDSCALRTVDPDRVAIARGGLLPSEETVRIAELFRMLGDATRARILYALLEAGELCVCDVAAAVEAGESAVSHALRLLRTAGIVRNRRDGRIMYYRLDDAHVRMLLDLTREHVEHGADRG
ncbi:MAG: ArsR/SmtB family transcription factor [Nitriliruptorales bacterium]